MLRLHEKKKKKNPMGTSKYKAIYNSSLSGTMEWICRKQLHDKF